MNIYLVSRWGAQMFLEEINPDLETTKDSNLLVRAKTWESALELANRYYAAYLATHEFFSELLKNGDELCDYIVQIGTDSVNETERVIHGPFLANAIIYGNSAFNSWQYESSRKTWKKIV